MKKFLAVLLGAAMLTGLLGGCGSSSSSSSAASSSAPASLSGSYTYQYQGMMGTETMQLDFASDGTVTMSLPGNNMITDKYAGTYTLASDGVTASIKALTNVDKSSQYTIPGLWSFIDSKTGDAAVTVNSDGTFAPAGGTASGSSAPAYSDVAYASNSQSQVLDLYLPAGTGPFPLVVLVHGGGFAMGDKSMPMVQSMLPLVDQGFAVAAVNYRMSGEATYPAAIADVKASVRYLRANAAKYNLDADNFAIWGESAGAYLAVMDAVTGDSTLTGDVTDNLGVSSSVKAVADFYGPVTFFQMDEDFAALGVQGSTNTDSSFESKFMGVNIASLDEATKTEMSPLTYINSGTALKVWIQAGTADANVPYTQSQRLADAFTAAIGADNVSFSLIEGAAHMDAAFYTADNLTALGDFLHASLK